MTPALTLSAIVALLLGACLILRNMGIRNGGLFLWIAALVAIAAFDAFVKGH